MSRGGGAGRLAEIALFLDAAALGSFSAAGRKHGLSPAAASAAIARLETALGATLFERTTRQLRLTQEGLHYRQYSEQALDLLAQAEDGLHAGGGVRGQVRISAPSNIGRQLLLPMLDRFAALHPQLRHALTLTDATANLVQDDVDLAIRYGELPDSDMVARLLHPGRRVVCVSPALAARVGLPATPRDLASLPTLVLTAGDGAPQEWRYRENGKRHSLRLQGAWHSNDGEILRRWAVAGHGYAYKSLLDIGDDLRAGRLQTVLDEYFADSVPLHLLYRRSRFQPPRVALLADFLLRQFAALQA
ncbi:LysR family transcriptional regulator [Janthinobacterium sp. SUN073]|uniref:LysR family transcriptional regulator n=1 Tax=Janthinobacterium sp. SUN073 TaxID=3004102 RepID=UPI0025AF5EE9|nr:LysR family transcriptional regulator [Janthinobacterium sp. SUN073]MDN2698146.1 LysR family transcriptional regulator [Janthinobacterium sp. SUN073]